MVVVRRRRPREPVSPSTRRRLPGRPSRLRAGHDAFPPALAATLTALLAASVVLAPGQQAYANPQVSGAWAGIFDWPVLPIHLAVLPDGRVLGFGGQTNGRASGLFNYAVWDPARGDASAAITKLPNTTNADFFCGSVVLDPTTGHVLIAGGAMTEIDHAGEGHVTSYGNQTSNVFRPETGTVAPGPPLSAARWYPTTTTLPDGRVLLQGGSDHNLGLGVATPEVYSPASRSWTPLTGINDADAYNSPELRWWYPRAWVQPNGKVLTVAGSLLTEIDPAGAGSLRRVGTLPGSNIGATSTAVMYRPGLILQVGGGAFANGDDRPASNAATIIDVRSGPPVIVPTAPMATARHWATATVLPTGDVLVTGGSPRNNSAEGATLAPELWNPETGTWRTLAAEQLPRLYHSAAALLPDGRVLSAAGGAPGPVLGLGAQVFSPPYLFAGSAPAARPVITAVPPLLAARTNFSVGVASTLPVTEVALIKTSAVTHSFNNDQRYLPLRFTQYGPNLTVQAPANGFEVPPGWYQLAVVDAAGVPSVAKIVWAPAQG